MVGNEMRIETRPAALNPAGACRSFTKLLSNRPAPTRSINDSATSPTTSPAPSRLRWDVAVRLLACSASTGACLAARSAGATPNNMPAPAEAASENAITEALISTSAPRGSPRTTADASSTSHIARTVPSAPPANASTALSAPSHFTNCSRLAPSAARIAVSCARAVARTSRRLATLAQAISSTRPTTAVSTSSGDRVLPTVRSPNRPEPQGLFGVGVGVADMSTRVAVGDRVHLRLHLLDAHTRAEDAQSPTSTPSPAAIC